LEPVEAESVVVGRGELTDTAWAQLAPLLPGNRQRGGRWRDHRTVINEILWKLRTGAPWRDLPERYGPWQSCYDRFVRWRQDGTWDRLLPTCRPSPTRLVSWRGASAWTPPACVPTSMPPVRASRLAARILKGDLP
jgi:transposase